jgi:fucose permease
LAGATRSVDTLALGAFVALGLPDGMIGTAWPVVRHGFGAPLADLGLVLIVATTGGVASSAVAGLVLARLGLARTVMLAGTIAALGAVGVATAPGLVLFVLSGAALGVASGLLDSSINTAVALARRIRLLNLVHGCYGLGTTIGPLVVTAAVLAVSWRPAYGVLALVELTLVCGWYWAGRQLNAGEGAAGAVAAGRVAPGPDGRDEVALVVSAAASASGAGAGDQEVDGTRDVPRHGSARAVAWPILLGLVVFAVYTGLEAAAGQWEPSFDRGVLHLGTAATGLATSGYWGALTLARFALATPRKPPQPATVVRWGCVMAVGGAALVWWRPAPVVALLGVVVVGAALAGVFPALVALTPARVGEERARHVIGWQIGAASIGGSLISAGLGDVFQRYGLREFGPGLVVVALVLVLGSVALGRMAGRAAAP